MFTMNFYQTALIPYFTCEDSGYNYELKYEKIENRELKRNATWYNPPFPKNVKTNIGKSFLQIVDKCFLPHHQLHKIFNRSTLKLSYSCMTNVKNIIHGHNEKIREENKKEKNTEHENEQPKTNVQLPKAD